MLDNAQKKWAQCKDERSSHKLSSFFIGLYRFKKFRSILLKLVVKLEGGKFFSRTHREILKQYHNVEVGAYSYGSCLSSGVLPAGTKVGNYCSFAENLKIYRRNHRLDTLSQHPFFYNRDAGLLKSDTIVSIADNPLVVGHDVWIGGNVIILPGCQSIGNGAVVGAGSVLTKNVPPFAIVAGNPAKIIRQRYTPSIIAAIEDSRWWSLKVSDLLSASDLLFEEVRIESLGLLIKESKEDAKNE